MRVKHAVIYLTPLFFLYVLGISLGAITAAINCNTNMDHPVIIGSNVIVLISFWVLCVMYNRWVVITHYHRIPDVPFRLGTIKTMTLLGPLALGISVAMVIHFIFSKTGEANDQSQR